VLTIASVPFALIGANTSIAWLSFAMFVRGIGMGFAFIPAMAAAYAALRREELSDATPQLNVLQRVGGSIGVAVLAVVLQRGLAAAGLHASPAEVAGAYGTAWWWATVVAAVAIIPCVILMRAERRVAARRRLEMAAPPVGDEPSERDAEPAALDAVGA
jgi:hypothetical protein